MQAVVCALILVHLQGLSQIHVICQPEHPTQIPFIIGLLRSLAVFSEVFLQAVSSQFLCS